MLEFGIRRGLGVRVNWDQQVQDERYHYMLNKQAQVEQEAKAKLFANDFDYNNAMNAHDNPVVKEFAKGKIKEIGTFIRNNPDWQQDIGKRSQYNVLIKELKDNPDLMRGLQSDAAKKDWDQWRAKNPELANSPDGKQIEQQWMNYEKTGHQFGEEGLAKDGKKSAFMFTPPELFDDEKVIADTFVRLPTQERNLTSKEFGKAVGAGATVADVNDERALTTAMGLLNDPRYAYKFQAKWKNASDAEKQYFNNNIAQWIAKRGKNYTKSDMNPGTYFAPREGGGSGKGNNGMPQYSQYTLDFQMTPKGQPFTTDAIDAVTPLVKGFGGSKVYVGTGKIRIPTISKDNKPTVRELGVNNFTNIESVETGSAMVGYDGVPLVSVRSKFRIADYPELSNETNGLFKNTRGTWGFGFAEDNEFVPNDANSQVAGVLPDKDGNPSEYGWIEHWVPANTSQNNRLAYDKKSVSANFAIDARDPRMQMEQQSEIQNIIASSPEGTEFDQNGVIYVKQGNLLVKKK